MNFSHFDWLSIALSVAVVTSQEVKGVCIFSRVSAQINIFGNFMQEIRRSFPVSVVSVLDSVVSVSDPYRDSYKIDLKYGYCVMIKYRVAPKKVLLFDLI